MISKDYDSNNSLASRPTGFIFRLFKEQEGEAHCCQMVQKSQRLALPTSKQMALTDTLCKHTEKQIN